MKFHPIDDASKSSMGILIEDQAPMKIMILNELLPWAIKGAAGLT